MIPRLLDSTHSLTALAADQTAGLGSLPEAVSCIVTEERNGAYTLQMKLPITAKHYEDVAVGGVILAKANENQPNQMFRIQKISRPIGGIVTISANHISYDLNKTSVAPFESTGASAAMAALKANMTGGAAFTVGTDVSNVTSVFTNSIPQSFRACLGGQRGSILDTFGGELEFNNLSVYLHISRGRNRGVVLRYGKNITDIRQDENIENMYTAVMPYAVDSAGRTVVGTLQTILQSEDPKILNLDLSDQFNGTGTEPTAVLINQKAQAYIEANNLTEPKVSIKVSFVALWQTEEYKEIAPLERVMLCDTVTVLFDRLGVNATAKVIKTVYNTLTERFDEIELGDAKSTLAKTINGIGDQIDAVAQAKTSFMDDTILSFTNLISNGLGLFMTGEQAGTAMKYYLHNKPTRAESQYQWTINASGFAVSSDYGATWSAGFDAEGNAVFNSLAANIVKAMQIYAGTLTFGEDTTTTLSDNDSDTGALFQGDGTMEFRTKGQFYARNLYNSGNLANYVRMNVDSDTAAWLRIANLLNSSTEYWANTLLFQKTGQNIYTYLENYQALITAVANSLIMSATETQHSTRIANNYVGTTDFANGITLTATDTEARTSLQNSASSSGLTAQLYLSSFDGEAPLALTLYGTSWASVSGIYMDDDGGIRIEAAGDITISLDGGTTSGKLGVATISGHKVLVLT